jgi:F-box and leucine-rich repeat protein 1 (S-phase kinase-associated protein 2)
MMIVYLDSTKLTAVSLNMMVDKLGYLESLSTSRCYGISPSSYLILSACPTLLYLNVFGLLRDTAMVELRQRLKGGFLILNIVCKVFFSGIDINKFLFTSIARPTVGIKRTSIWNLRVRE